MSKYRERCFGGSVGVWIRKKKAKHPAPKPQSKVTSSISNHSLSSTAPSANQGMPPRSEANMREGAGYGRKVVASDETQQKSEADTKPISEAKFDNHSGKNRSDSDSSVSFEPNPLRALLIAEGQKDRSKRAFGAACFSDDLNAPDTTPNTNLALVWARRMDSSHHEQECNLPSRGYSETTVLSIGHGKEQELLTIARSTNAPITTTEAISAARNGTNENDATSPADPATAETPRQPTSKTSLTVARKFFQQLDSEHPLQLDSTASTPQVTAVPALNRMVCGRTHRTPLQSFSEKELQREFELYREACQDAGVAPRPWSTFMSGRYYAPSGMYDGMFDD